MKNPLERAGLPARPIVRALRLAAVGLAIWIGVLAASPRGPIAAGEEVLAADFTAAGGGAKLIVNVHNSKDDSYVARGRIQLGIIGAPAVAPVNAAIAQSSCVDCETMAVALQIAVYRRGAPYVAPANAAVAVNAGCTRCFTLAVAIQYAIPVADPTNVPPDVRKLARDLNADLRSLTLDTSTPVRQRLTGLTAIVDRFGALAAFVAMRVEQATEPNQTSADEPAPSLPAETDDPNASAAPAPPDAGSGSPGSESPASEAGNASASPADGSDASPTDATPTESAGAPATQPGDVTAATPTPVPTPPDPAPTTAEPVTSDSPAPTPSAGDTASPSGDPASPDASSTTSP